MTNYAQKYNATRFDPSNPNDVMAERARQIVVGAFTDALTEFEITSGDDITSIITGLTVGIACIMEAHFDRTGASQKRRERRRAECRSPPRSHAPSPAL